MSFIFNSAFCDARETRLMQIEASYASGFAGLQLIGNTSEVCRDGKERAKTALESLHIQLPPQRLVVSFTPADVRKDGSQFDLPLAVCLAALVRGENPCVDPREWLFAGELNLDGNIRPVRGAISFAIAAIAHGMKGLIVSAQSLPELRHLSQLEVPGWQNLKVIGFNNLKDVLSWVFDNDHSGVVTLEKTSPALVHDLSAELNFDDMMLDHRMEMIALTVAVGEHSLLLRGTPGSGKSMFASRIASILPEMRSDEHLEALKIRSTFGSEITPILLSGRPPFRQPHHQASAPAILGTHDYPGELSLAHGGVLFLDELPEFRRDILEGLREPLETGTICVSRSRQRTIWPARVLMLAACNNCPCGWSASSMRRCSCATSVRKAYANRLSGPILDRIDMHINMTESHFAAEDLFKAGLKNLNTSAQNTSSSQTQKMRDLVLRAREFSKNRCQSLNVCSNKDLQAHQLVEASGLSELRFYELVNNFSGPKSSKRSMIRTIRVARTLADLRQSEVIDGADLITSWSWQSESCARERGDHLQGA